MQNEQDGFWEENGYYADPNVFEVFSFPLLKGSPKTALKDPFAIVITEPMAQKYFGKQNPIGQTLTVQDTLTLTVTGILEPIPANLHFTFDFLISMETKQRAGLYPHTNWGKFGYFTYILLAPSTSTESIKSQIWDITRKYIGEAEDQNGFHFKHFLQPITDIHLHSNMEWDISTTTPINHIYIFSSIGFFILLIACINFMNLATARSITRAKEVGMRKVVGAYRKQLIMQFLGEACLTTALAVGIAIAATELILPTFNTWAGKDLNLLQNLPLLLKLTSLILFIGLLSGTYPAFALSKFHPIDVLKGTLKTNSQGAFMRKGLVVFQFAISIILIVGTLVVYHQLTYMQNQDLGFNKEQVIVVNLRSKIGQQATGLQKRYEPIKAGVLNNPNVLHTSASWTVPGRALSPFTFTYEGPSGTESKTMFGQSVDYDFIPTYSLNLIAGRNFSKSHITDETEAILLNEQAVSYLELDTPTEAIGKTITIGKNQHRVIGVIADFHHHGLHKTIGPLMMQIRPNRFTYISIKTRTENMANTLANLEKSWQDIVPNRPFEYFFLDEDFEKQYRTEERLGRIFTTFSTLAIFIGCLGLFGLISFEAQQRTKEIGIRKVLGASASNLIILLSKDFLKLVLISNLIAWPVAYYAMNQWLQDFAYRINLNVGTFIISGLIVLCIALFTISYQAIKAARANPIDSLHYE
jgi:putative ABC transport system permease protein